ncbi:MAG: hypothetical protein R6T98_16210 [Desulfatiglandales bacterium]
MDTLLKRPAREPRPPARRAYDPEGTEKKPIVFRSIGVMQRFRAASISTLSGRILKGGSK